MNKKLIILASVIFATFYAQAAKELVDGYTWEYTVKNGEATVTGVSPLSGSLIIPTFLAEYPVRIIGADFMHEKGGSVSRVVIPEGVREVGDYAFYGCYIDSVTIPFSVEKIGKFGFGYCTVDEWNIPENVDVGYRAFYALTIKKINARCAEIPSDKQQLDYIYNYDTRFSCRKMFAKYWMRRYGSKNFLGYIDDMPEVEIVSSAMRKDDPTVMDVVYKVHSSAKTVKVRAMAWENGERNLSKAIRPTKWIEGTEANIGDAVTANEEHKLSWRIAGDWATDLSKVKLEVLAVEDDLLPLELQTIPATATHQKMKISWNKMTADHVFDALLWLYADGDEGLTLTNGMLRNGANFLASGTGLYNTTASIGYVFGKMGYQVLAGDELAYARRVTQLELPVSGVEQFAVKYPDAK